MDWRGHLGFNMLITSALLYMLSLSGVEANRLILLSSVLSSIPDIDLRFELPHRKVTHNVFFGITISLLAGYIASSLNHYSFEFTFVVFLTAFTTHILGDLMTKLPFRPLYPLIRTPVSLRLFRSSNNLVNTAFLIAGVATYYVYISKFGFAI
ncbi:MAG: metal-dependent hydrolase [Zestosphaera sp.]